MTQISGVFIQWKHKDTQNFNDVKDGDYTLINSNPCPVINGEPIPTMPDGYEWLANNTESNPVTYDPRIFIELQHTLPTNLPHPQWPMYNQYRTTFSLEKRSTDQIVESVRQEERLANNTLITEAEKEKMDKFTTGYLISISKGLSPDEAQLNAVARHQDVEVKMNRNASNAEGLIGRILLGENVDISSGWEYDNIPVGGFPFSN